MMFRATDKISSIRLRISTAACARSICTACARAPCASCTTYARYRRTARIAKRRASRENILAARAHGRVSAIIFVLRSAGAHLSRRKTSVFIRKKKVAAS